MHPVFFEPQHAAPAPPSTHLFPRPQINARIARWTAANALAWALALPLFFATVDAMPQQPHVLWLGMGAIGLLMAGCQAAALRGDGVSSAGWSLATAGGMLLSVWAARYMVGNDGMDAVFILQPIGITVVGLCQGLALHAQRRLHRVQHGLTWIGFKALAAGLGGGLLIALCHMSGPFNPTCSMGAALLGGALSGAIFGVITGAALQRLLARAAHHLPVNHLPVNHLPFS